MNDPISLGLHAWRFRPSPTQSGSGFCPRIARINSNRMRKIEKLALNKEDCLPVLEGLTIRGDSCDSRALLPFLALRSESWCTQSGRFSEAMQVSQKGAKETKAGELQRKRTKNAPGGVRTHNLRLRRPSLYPVELRVLKRRDYSAPSAGCHPSLCGENFAMQNFLIRRKPPDWVFNENFEASCFPVEVPDFELSRPVLRSKNFLIRRKPPD